MRDYPQEIIVDLTATDIALAGPYQNPFTCPIATALKRMGYEDGEFLVVPDEVRFLDDRVNYRLPEHADRAAYEGIPGKFTLTRIDEDETI